MHRESWVALSCCFIVAMGILLLFAGSIAPAGTTIVTTTTITTVSRGSALPPAPPEPEPPPAIEVAKETYAGNIKTKKFHRMSCRYANCTNCRAKFASRAEAIEAGFDPCGTCDP